MVYGLSQFLARIVIRVEKFLARGGLWWLVCCFRNDRWDVLSLLFSESEKCPLGASDFLS